ncbi:MAG: 5'-nucleotidase C-terminal domain-containing protein [Nitrospiraceae bacterium]|nr:5'-nucleotidase C-terminal domain-containing protein [Nitrospiraceae bacterium]
MKRLLQIIFILVFFLSCATLVFAGRQTIRILHVNDFHGFAEPYRPLSGDERLGGIAYLAARADELRREKPSLLLSAGDMVQGNNWTNLFQGEPVIQVMDLMAFDAMVPGNHEFDFGQDVLRKRISEALFPVLAANVEGFGSFKPYIIREVGGVKVAIIGIVTKETPVSTHPRNVAGLTFSSPADTMRRYLPELRKNADIVIVLSHIGYAADRVLAEQVNGIDIIVGGHSHTKLDHPATVGDTIIVQAWEHAKTLGVLDITVEDSRIVRSEGHLEVIRPSGREDAAVAAVVQRYGKKVDAVLDERIGSAGVDLDGENVRLMETNLGDLIADIMRKASGADAAIINSGGIRTSIRKGDIRMKDVYSVLPFDNYIVAARLTGRQIRQALDHGVSAVENGEGRFPQVSGLNFRYDRSAPAGSRVTEVFVRGEPLLPDKEYTVATNDFLAAGGDGYKAFGDAVKASRDFEVVGGMMKGERLVYNDSGRWLRDVVAAYIREKKNIAPQPEGRILEGRR